MHKRCKGKAPIALEPATGLQFAGALAEISVIDLMLSADNALLIAMCCASLPPAHVRNAVVLGTAGAIVLRYLLTTIAGLLLQIPYLKIAGWSRRFARFA